MADAETACLLLDIPAELRNRIYDLVLNTQPSDMIEVDDRHFQEPNLLQTCRQIRQEASPIFHAQCFKLRAGTMHFDPQLQHWIRTKVNSELRTLHYSGGCKWEKLWVWFKLCHQGTIDVSRFSNEGCVGDDSREKAFQIATVMRSSTWEVTKQVLELFKQGAEAASRDGPGMNGDYLGDL